MSPSIEQFQCIDRTTATDFQRLAIKTAELHAIGMGYTGAGNRPDNSARIEITGTPDAGTVTRFIVLFYPVGDTRLINPFYNANRTTLTVTQTLAALPGWISALTNIPINEAAVVVYYATQDRYEFECLRRLTHKT
jgi:hypothetical protein